MSDIGEFVCSWNDTQTVAQENLNLTDKGFDTTYVSLVAYPILLLVCTVGNILNIFILSHREKIQVKEVLLLSLAISDLLILWVCLPSYLYYHVHHFWKPINYKIADYQALLISSQGLGYFKWLQYTFYYVSDGILILFSCERLVAFRWPHFHRMYCNRRHFSVLAVVLLTFLSALICIGNFFWYYYWQACSNDGHHLIFDNRPGWLTWWDKTQKQIDIILPVLILTTVLIINIWLLCHLRENLIISSELHARSSSYLNDSTVLPEQREPTSPFSSGMYFPVLGCVILYFMTQFPATIINTMEYVCSAPLCWMRCPSQLEQLRPIVWTLTLVNYSANFLVYVGLSKKYRLLSRKVLHLHRPTETSRRLSGAQESDSPLLALSKLRRLSRQQRPTFIEMSSVSIVKSNLSSKISAESGTGNLLVSTSGCPMRNIVLL